MTTATIAYVAEPRTVVDLNGHAGPCMYERCEERAYKRVEWRIVDAAKRLVDGEHALDYGIALAWYCDEHAPSKASNLPANWLHCDACKRAGTWWDLNTLGCTHATGCALDAAREHEQDTKEATT